MDLGWPLSIVISIISGDPELVLEVSGSVILIRTASETQVDSNIFRLIPAKKSMQHLNCKQLRNIIPSLIITELFPKDDFLI